MFKFYLDQVGDAAAREVLDAVGMTAVDVPQEELERVAREAARRALRRAFGLRARRPRPRGPRKAV